MSNRLFSITPRRNVFNHFSPFEAGDSTSLISLFDRVFDQNITTRPDRYGEFIPRANIAKSQTGYSLELAAPGFSRSDFKINVENNTLTVSSQSDSEIQNEDINYTSREFSHSSFSRSWTLPDGVQSDVITARYDAGVLTLDIPTSEKSNKCLTINVD